MPVEGPEENWGSLSRRPQIVRILDDLHHRSGVLAVNTGQDKSREHVEFLGSGQIFHIATFLAKGSSAWKDSQEGDGNVSPKPRP